MKKKILLILACALMIPTTITLTACGGHSHTAGEWTQTTTTHTRKCTECGDEMESGEHIYDDDCDATCNTCGYHRDNAPHSYDNACDTECNLCGATREITHSYGEYQIDFVNQKHYRSCSVCNDIETDDHHYQSGVCLECKDAENVTYTYTENAYTLTSAQNSTASSIVIPATYNDGTHGDHPVTAIAEKAFYACTNLQSVTIPASVTTIGSEAFNFCINLSTANFAGTISQWAQISFSTYSSNPALYSKSLYINSERVTEVALTTDVSEISNYAFFDFEDITKITVPNSVTKIGALAFGNCSNLTEIELGNGISSILKDAFNNCVKLAKVNYTGTNSQWAQIAFVTSSSNPISYAKSLYINDNLLTELNYSATDSITQISKYAFYNCEKLTNLITGSKLKTIGEDAFYGCADLKSIIINENVNDIDGNAFKYCPSLEEIKVNSYNPTYNTSYPTDINCVVSGGQIIIGCKNTKFSTTIISSIGEEAFAGCGIETLEIPKNITSINEYAFTESQNLKSVSIPNSCTIGDFAFSDCPALESVNISKGTIGSNAFADCTNLTNVTMGDGITKIERQAFCWCKNITTITIPASVTSIGDNAFFGCYRLAEVYDLRAGSSLEAGDDDSGYLAYYAVHVYYSTDETSKMTTENGYQIYTNGEDKVLVAYTGTDTKLILPEGITEIKQRAFYNCTSITSITIPASVKKIGICAFEGCDSLETLIVDSNNTTFYSKDNCIIRTLNKELVAGCKSSIIPTDGSVTQIAQYAFYNCHNLQNITIPDSVEYIHKYAFGYCTGLTNLTVGSGIKIIHPNAFVECESLAYVNYTGTIDSWAEINFKKDTGLPNSSNPASFAGALHINGQLVTAINLTTATKISAYAFYEFKNITSVVMGDSVTSVEADAFNGCEQLESVIFSNSSQSTIYDSTFYNCYNLKTLVIPASIKTVQNYAFFNCANLKNVYSLGTVGYNTITVNNYSLTNDNIFFINATKYSYNSQPTTSGNYWHFADDGVTPVIWENVDSQA